MDNVTITLHGETVEIEPDAWEVIMLAVNVLVDTGDITVHGDISRATLAKARMASGALYLIARHHRSSAPIAASQP
jgi:hypothetical protein